MKVNFTKEHFNQMCNYLISMLITNTVVTTKMGTPLNVVELLHTTTIKTLNGIRIFITKQISNLENEDEWVATESTQTKLENLKNLKEAINLIIGYKRYNLEVEEAKRQRVELEAKLAELKESQKTPADRIKEIEDELKDLETTEF